LSEKATAILSETEIKVFKSLASVALALIAGAGILTLAVVAPNLLGAIGKISTLRFKGKGLSKTQKAKKATQTIYYLKKSGLIRIKRTSKEIFLSLTEKGKKQLQKIDFDILRVRPQQKWDRKWWLVAADIPTKAHKVSADLFRKKLKEMHFWGLQRTLWLYPFDPTGEIQFIAEHFGIQKYVTVMEVNRLDRADEKFLKKHFKSAGIL
jgi:hypothetical protein